MKVSFDRLEQVYDGTISDAEKPPLTFLSPELVDTTSTTNTTESNTSPDPNINPPSENHADDDNLLDKLQQKYPQLATSIKSKLKEIDSHLFQDPSTDSSESTTTNSRRTNN